MLSQLPQNICVLSALTQISSTVCTTYAKPSVDPHWFQYGSGSGFFLNADPDPDPGSQTNATPAPDPDPGRTLKLQKVKF